MNNLSTEYRLTAQRLFEHKLELEKQIKFARGEDFFLLQKRIQIIKDEINELNQISSYIRKNYCN